MENKKSIFGGSVIASAIIGLSSLTANASTMTNYSALGTGGEVRAELLSAPNSAFGSLELTCGAKTASKKEAKGKEGKCGKGKKGKGKEGKCGEGKCGEGKKKNPM